MPAIRSVPHPNREEYDALHEKVLEKLNKKYLSNTNNGVPSTKSKSKRGGAGGVGASSAASSTALTSAHADETSMDMGQVSNEHISNPLTNNETANNTNNHNHHNKGKRTAQDHRNHSDDSDIESRTSTEQSSSLHMANDLDEIELVLKPHPLKEMTLTSNRFLKTTSNATGKCHIFGVLMICQVKKI